MRSSLASTAAVLACAVLGRAEVYFHEDFSADSLDSTRWIASEAKPDLGKFEISPGAWFADEKKSRGLRTHDAKLRYYAISVPLDKTFETNGKDLVIQFSVKHEQVIDCGGGYLKLLPPDFSPKNFSGDSPYEIMFGPDICGPTRRVHVIFRYKDDNKLIKKHITCPSDQLTHLYTLIVKPDQTYKVLVDQKEEASGNLLEDWDFLPPKTIKDPDVKKPEDWVEKPMIGDPEDKKPEGYDDIPEYIPDPDAKKPEDWDDDADGEWVPSSKENPEYKGEWKPRQIRNPDYKGPWVHPEIPNPDYAPDEMIVARSIGYIGFDLWQVTPGTIFDDILVTDSVDEAEKAAKADFEEWQEKEGKAKEKFDEEETEKEMEKEESLKNGEETRKQEELKEKVEEVVAAEELAAIEENEPIEDSLGGSLADTAAGAVVGTSKDAAAASGLGAGVAGNEIKHVIKDEL